ncbi:DUF488 domain-containing protein [Asaia prunellae]|uniref:DUF488 domain-containing protein n=1 Tax=Asaia prunellae TaxID=610245 RepID=UPI0004718EEE|nr:DUF488 domain-containing protein [Asaia prunellae]
MPEILLKRAYETPDANDGTRILVDRLWPRGIRKADLKASIWLKDVAPSTDLRKWFDHDSGKWILFREKYVAELRSGSDELNILLSLARSQKITLLYAAHDEIHNHALILRDFLNSETASIY